MFSVLKRRQAGHVLEIIKFSFDKPFFMFFEIST